MNAPLIDPKAPAAMGINTRDALVIAIASGAGLSFGARFNRPELTMEKIKQAAAVAADTFLNAINQE
jgi:hypothetical protein